MKVQFSPMINLEQLIISYMKTNDKFRETNYKNLVQSWKLIEIDLDAILISHDISCCWIYFLKERKRKDLNILRVYLVHQERFITFSLTSLIRGLGFQGSMP